MGESQEGGREQALPEDREGGCACECLRAKERVCVCERE